MADDITPSDLARELDVSEKRVRDHLRERFGTLPQYTDNWHLNRRTAQEVRKHFLAKR
jgi:AraC-like DNA-binding protein